MTRRVNLYAVSYETLRSLDYSVINLRQACEVGNTYQGRKVLGNVFNDTEDTRGFTTAAETKSWTLRVRDMVYEPLAATALDYRRGSCLLSDGGMGYVYMQTMRRAGVTPHIAKRLLDEQVSKVNAGIVNPSPYHAGPSNTPITTFLNDDGLREISLVRDGSNVVEPQTNQLGGFGEVTMNYTQLIHAIERGTLRLSDPAADVSALLHDAAALRYKNTPVTVYTHTGNTCKNFRLIISSLPTTTQLASNTSQKPKAPPTPLVPLRRPRRVG